MTHLAYTRDAIFSTFGRLSDTRGDGALRVLRAASGEGELVISMIPSHIDIQAESTPRSVLLNNAEFDTYFLRPGEFEFWTAAGRDGAEWLIQRSTQEHTIEVLDAISDRLGAIGVEAAKSILDALEQPGSLKQVATLLTALSWFRHPVSEALSRRAETILDRLFTHATREIRSIAFSATKALPPNRAIEMLRNALDAEQDPGLRADIEEELSEIAAE